MLDPLLCMLYTKATTGPMHTQAQNLRRSTIIDSDGWPEDESEVVQEAAEKDF